MRLYNVLTLSLLLPLFYLSASDRSITNKFHNNMISVDRVVWDGNQISNAHGNIGEIVSYYYSSLPGMEWPKESGKHTVFQSGLWLVAAVVDEAEEIRVATTTYNSEFVPGNWDSDPEDPAYRIYTINADDGPTSTNWQEWPVDQGAPWVDVDGDGFYDPLVDHPDIIGDKYQWYVMNDGDDSVHSEVYNTQPIGIEVAVSVFGFNTPGPLGNTMFLKFKLTNSGAHQLDSMFVSLWSEFDLGHYTDDFVGCNPQLNLGFGYNDFNGDLVYGASPPVVGYAFLQTPIIPSPGDTAWVSGEPVLDFRNVPMNAFTKYASGDPDHLPWTAQEVIWNMNGLSEYDGQPFIDPTTGETSTFVYSGDPVTGEGWVDYNYGVPEGNRQFLMTAGPFSMSPADTHEIIAAIIVAQGADNLLSIVALRDYLYWVRSAYQSNFNDLGPGAELIELDIPYNMEDTGPFEMVVGIEQDSLWEHEISSIWLHYMTEDIQDSLLMMETIYNDTTAYGGTIPAIPEIAGTTELHYYFSLDYEDGTEVLLPYGAPLNYNAFLFGPDTTAPQITDLEGLPHVLYLIDGEEQISVSITDDRFPILSASANWKVNADGNVEESPLTQDEDIWTGEITWQDLEEGDTVYYWVTALDSSMNQNSGISETKWFLARSWISIGNWEDEIIDEWNWGNGWSLGPEGAYGKVAKLSAGLEEGEQDSLTRIRTTGMTEEFDNLFLRFSQQYLFVAPNIGLLQLRVDTGDWETVRTYEGDQTEFIDEVFSLEPYVGADSLFLRFLAEGHGEFGGVIWNIDDIFMEVDTSMIVDGEVDSPVPFSYELYQNYPNPFNAVTIIEYDLLHSQRVKLVIYDILGQEIARPVDSRRDAGRHKVIWNGKDYSGKSVSAGVYFYRVKAGDFVKVRKLVLLK